MRPNKKEAQLPQRKSTAVIGCSLVVQGHHKGLFLAAVGNQ